MKTLDLEQMEQIEAGGFVAGFCIGMTGGSIIYGALALTNFWNPVGWVTAGLLAVDTACMIYGANQL